MLNNKIKVSTELGQIWLSEDYRQFLKEVSLKTDEFELYIISDDIYHLNYQNISKTLNIPANRLIICTGLGQKLNNIINLGIEIHLDGVISRIEDINKNSSCKAILVDYIADKYHQQRKYITDFNTSVTLIQKDEQKQTPC